MDSNMKNNRKHNTKRNRKRNMTNNRKSNRKHTRKNTTKNTGCKQKTRFFEHDICSSSKKKTGTHRGSSSCLHLTVAEKRSRNFCAHNVVENIMFKLAKIWVFQGVSTKHFS